MELIFNGLWPRGLRHGAKDVGHTFVGKSLALLGSLGQCAFAHSIQADGPPTISVEFWAWVPAQTVTACALIGLHMKAEEGTLRTGILLLTWEKGGGLEGRAGGIKLPCVCGTCTWCSECQRGSLELSQQQSLLSPWTGCHNEGEGFGERSEGEGT